ncbi:HAD family hydrolase [Acidaminobacter sp. JC074]|uniref:HAD family hydrolase n=1 Tax=Acidaminobacter sp. JC074 TaxID=2530199 RepID=UPI001F10A841|nr:HAD family hydrolase [Acidaminobacter sp. JC074]MCH4889117.1 HAD family hydrolase [Acidaminobacter sp. JC074]
MYKMIACDLDGTLLDSNHEITDDNRQIIDKLKEKDIPFVIATGRIYPSAAEFSKDLNLSTPIIACNGAVIKDPVEDKILFDYPVPTESMLELVRICKKHDIYFHIYTIDTVYAERNERLILKYNEWKKKDPMRSLVKTAVVEDIVPIIEANIVYKLGIYVDEEGAQEAYEEMVKVPGITSCFSLTTLVDIFNEEASKGIAVQALIDMYGLNKDQVMALGDNENDISMLKHAGLGIAMKDARDHVKSAADEVTESNDDSGVAVAIKKHLAI